MGKSILLIAALLTAFCATPAGHAQSRAAPAVRIVTSADGAPYSTVTQAIRRVLGERRAELATTIHVIDAAGAPVPALAAQGTDIVIGLGSRALRVLRQLPATTPVTGCLALGGEFDQRITGVTLEHPAEMQLALLRRFLPQARTIGVIYDPAENRQRVERLAAAAKKLGLTLIERPVRDARELSAALSDIIERIDLLFGLPDATVYSPQTARTILLASFRHRVPLAGLSDAWVKAGALYAIDWDLDDIGTQCAEAALRGGGSRAAAPQPPRKLVYSVNLRAAQHMGISLESALLGEVGHRHE